MDRVARRNRTLLALRRNPMLLRPNTQALRPNLITLALCPNRTLLAQHTRATFRPTLRCRALMRIPPHSRRMWQRSMDRVPRMDRVARRNRTLLALRRNPMLLRPNTQALCPNRTLART
jgi:hypothetical protein